MMLEPQDNATLLQRTARQVLVMGCVIFAAGLLGAAAVNAVDAADPTVRVVEEWVVADEADAQLAAVDIQTDSHSTNSSIPHEATPASQPAVAPAPAERILWMEVTAYCPCVRCCGDDSPGITASGKPVSYNNGEFVAADTSLLPFGTRLRVPGYAGGEIVEVIDRGGAIKGHKLDLYFDSHQEALEWGRQWVAVTVVE